ncbi:DUF805 domain-containing protein [Sulfitobacter sp. R18_1]|uniref:DUF805 domain-containing protein n=1 Tax=Sulfitobacter sp. R18_1 TaxID=2821104 RepID=UPI001ADBF1B0|nr:DUF805 domain-containing protein [Sulfitobacter sp. R18_1]MBO9428748.1 DUF805 domain-containing protein [Sulfitobacter sp. R18_1]
MTLKSSLKDNYFSFSGRASRSEYWKLHLCYIVINVIMGAFIAAFGTSMASPNAIGGAVFITMLFVSAYFFIPLISVSVRRLHDLELSGWWSLVPAIIGALLFVRVYASILWSVSLCLCIAWLILAFIRGTHGENEYGDDPAIEAAK